MLSSSFDNHYLELSSSSATVLQQPLLTPSTENDNNLTTIEIEDYDDEEATTVTTRIISAPTEPQVGGVTYHTHSPWWWWAILLWLWIDLLWLLIESSSNQRKTAHSASSSSSSSSSLWIHVSMLAFAIASWLYKHTFQIMMLPDTRKISSFRNCRSYLIPFLPEVCLFHVLVCLLLDPWNIIRIILVLLLSSLLLATIVVLLLFYERCILSMDMEYEQQTGRWKRLLLLYPSHKSYQPPKTTSKRNHHNV